MTKFRSWFRRQAKRMRVRLHIWNKNHKVFKAPEIVNGYENISSAIVRKMISHPDSKFTIAPLSEKRYIVNKTVDIFVIIEDAKVEITNHVYHYVVTLGERDMHKIKKLYDQKVEDERLAYEEQIKSQITNTLHTIYNKINEQS
jgi:hypothetical protein